AAPTDTDDLNDRQIILRCCHEEGPFRSSASIVFLPHRSCGRLSRQRKEIGRLCGPPLCAPASAGGHSRVFP
ncbi:MAG TPA: hypothetical protein VIV12_14355, partial [Streptosporangiaceae bacterium]